MFDKPQYLTGNNGEGFVEPGETFWLHRARLDGTVKINDNERPQAKLLVSKDRNGDRIVVWTAGAGIVNQVKRFDQNDQASLPIEVRLDQIASGKGNPTNVLTPASAAPPADAPTGEAF
jgi:hypothetical protein